MKAGKQSPIYMKGDRAEAPGQAVNGTNGNNGHQAKPPSIWAIKQQIEAIENELRDLMYPGGCSWKKDLQGEDLEKAKRLIARRNDLKSQLLGEEPKPKPAAPQMHPEVADAISGTGIGRKVEPLQEGEF